MSFLRNVLVLSLVAQVVVGQSSTSEAMFSIQTDPATPTSSASASSAASPSASGALGSGMGVFPEQCGDDCSPVAQSLSSCGLGDLTGFNVTCLCNASVERNLLTCIDCALGADPNPQQAMGSYQSLLDAYIAQCAYASVTLSSATVGLSSSASGASSSGSSGSASSSTSTSAAASSTSMSGSASSSQAASSTQASSASSAAASSTPSNTAARGMDRAWAWGLTGVGGVVVAAAVGL